MPDTPVTGAVARVGIAYINMARAMISGTITGDWRAFEEAENEARAGMMQAFSGLAGAEHEQDYYKEVL